MKRASFSLIAEVFFYHKKMADDDFEPFLILIKNVSTDDRKYVKKSVNWALHNIGKRNMALNQRAIEVAREILQISSKSAHWIAAEALRELTSEKMQKMVGRQEMG